MLINLDTGYCNGLNLYKAADIFYRKLQEAKDIEKQVIESLPQEIRKKVMENLAKVEEEYKENSESYALRKEAFADLLRAYAYQKHKGNSKSLSRFDAIARKKWEQAMKDSRRSRQTLTKKNVV